MGTIHPLLGLGSAKIMGTSFRADYLIHSLAFFILPVLAYRANGYKGRVNLWYLFIIISAVLAIGTEFLQLLVPGRVLNPLDTISNLVGLLIGVVAVLIYQHFIKRK
jgi:VanZ family protein